MEFSWKKRGLVFSAAGQFGWMNSHAQVPTAIVLEDIIRVFFASRPRRDLSLSSYVDLAIDDPKTVVYLHSEPILATGSAGAFDEHGIMPQHALLDHDSIYLFYAGWSRRASIPYSNWIGLAKYDRNEGSFVKCSDAPILDRISGDILSATGLSCILEGSGWVGWYASGTDWVPSPDNSSLNPIYEIRQCRSHDLLHWSRDLRPLFQTKLDKEANTRPTVIFVGGKWLMWFCYRSAFDFHDGKGSYRIGFAWTDNLLTWHRNDGLAGINVHDNGWDSTMIAYPNIVRVKDRYLMFYNGNGFGEEGFGYAEVSAEEMEEFSQSLSAQPREGI